MTAGEADPHSRGRMASVRAPASEMRSAQVLLYCGMASAKCIGPGCKSALQGLHCAELLSISDCWHFHDGQPSLLLEATSWTTASYV